MDRSRVDTTAAGATWFEHGEPAAAPEKPDVPVAVMIHGLGGSSFFLRDSAQFVSRLLPTMVFDLPGHGRRRHDRVRVSSFAEYVDLVETYVAAAGLSDATPVVFIGHSLGALIALELVRRRHGPKGIVLIDGICISVATSLGLPFFDARRRYGLRLTLFARWIALSASFPYPERLLSTICSSHVLRAACFWPYLCDARHASSRRLERALRGSGSRVVRHNVREISTVDLPSLYSGVEAVSLISGGGDRFITVDDEQFARSTLRPLYRCEIPGAGHWPMFDNPEAFRSALVEAVGALSARWEDDASGH